jgi:beta-glucosidase
LETTGVGSLLFVTDPAEINRLHTIFPVPIGLAPMVDIARDPRRGRIVEGAGEDPYLGAAMAAAQVGGFQGSHLGAADHIMAGPKHFAGYGASLGGHDYDEANISEAP